MFSRAYLKGALLHFTFKGPGLLLSFVQCLYDFFYKEVGVCLEIIFY